MENGVLPLIDDVYVDTTALEKQPSLELSVVVPTYQERLNIVPFLLSLELALKGIPWEVIFVDDHSPDRTADLIRSFAVADPRIRVLERLRRRGLSSACIEGMMSSAAPFIAVMDADMQHDETVLPAMLRRLQSHDLDIVVASRGAPGGSMGDLAAGRVWLSKLGSRLSQIICHCDITDPMSGFFIARSQFLRSAAGGLTGAGFKILVDILASSQTPPRIAEVPYRFRHRFAGDSKLDVSVALAYLYLLLDKLVGRYLPTRFALFVGAGFLGMLLHMSVLGLFRAFDLPHFSVGQALATLVTMMIYFFLSNIGTLRDRRMKGWGLLQGLLVFYVACAFGLLINLTFADRLLLAGLPWYVAGACGMAISSCWNYGVNTMVTWRRSLHADTRSFPPRGWQTPQPVSR